MLVSEKMLIAVYYREKRFGRKIPRPESKDLRLRLGDNVYKPLKECPQTDDDFVQLDDYCRKRLGNHVLPFGSTTRHRRPRAKSEVRDEERGYDGVATRGAGAPGEGASGRLID
jgi:hypothetical protein